MDSGGKSRGCQNFFHLLYLCMNVCTYTYMYAHTYEYMNTYECTHVSCMYVRICMYVSMYTHINICMYICIYVELVVHSLNESKFLDCEKLCSMSLVLLAHSAIYCCLTCLALLFNAMNIHGYVPNQLGLSVVMPTLKYSTKSINDIENYRPIIIMLQVRCLRNALPIILSLIFSRENQFGFVKNCGCGRRYLLLEML